MIKKAKMSGQEKEIHFIKKKKKAYKTKYIGIILFYHYSASEEKKHTDKHKVKDNHRNNNVDTNEPKKQKTNNSLYETKPTFLSTIDRSKYKYDTIKINVSKFMLKDNQYIYTIDYEKTFKIYKYLKQHFHIKKKNVYFYYKINVKEYKIFIISLNKCVLFDSESSYQWRSYMDFYKNVDVNCDNNYSKDISLYSDILDNTYHSIFVSSPPIKNGHLDSYLYPDNDESLPLLTLRKIYANYITYLYSLQKK